MARVEAITVVVPSTEQGEIHGKWLLQGEVTIGPKLITRPDVSLSTYYVAWKTAPYKKLATPDCRFGALM